MIINVNNMDMAIEIHSYERGSYPTYNCTGEPSALCWSFISTGDKALDELLLENASEDEIEDAIFDKIEKEQQCLQNRTHRRSRLTG